MKIAWFLFFLFIPVFFHIDHSFSSGKSIPEQSTAFSWAPVSEAVSYVVRICKEHKCKIIVLEKKQRETILKTNLRSGTYYFSVAPVDSSGQIGYFSTPKKFNVAKPGSYDHKTTRIVRNTPTITTPLDKQKIRSTSSIVTVKWQAGDFVNYKLKVEYKPPRKKTFRTLSNITTKKKSYIIRSPSQGFYRLTLSALSKDRISVSALPTEFQIVKFAPPAVVAAGKSKSSGSNILKLISSSRNQTPNSISIGLLYGKPKSSVTAQSDPDFVQASNESPGNLFVVGAKYRREIFKYFSSGIEFSHSLPDSSLALITAAADVRYIAKLNHFTIYPLLGFYFLRFSVKNTSADNFIIRKYFQPVAGTTLDFHLPFHERSFLSAKLVVMGTKFTATEWSLAYRFLLSPRYICELSYNSFSLRGHYHSGDYNEKELTESFSGPRFEFGINF